ncbi:MAG TPA: tyrosine-type recombinase/integrase [Hanamia sp.]|nr:tyrosine-type recombinase/integrase [Hanamia sp.]
MKNKKSTELDLLEEFNQFVKATEKGKRTKQNGTRILKGSVVKLDATYKALKSFSDLKGFPLKIKVFKRANTRVAQSQKTYWNRFYQKFSDYLYNDLDCYDNYAGSVMKDLRSFFNYLVVDKNMMIGNYHKKFYAYKETIEIVTLQPEQLNFLIYDKGFEDLLSPTLLKVKDIFVVGCTVALRYSDLINLKPSNLEKENNQWYLKVQSKKTQTYTRIKLPGYVVQVFLKYTNKKRLLPFYNLVALNLYVKRLAEKAGWIEEKIKTRQKRGIAMVVYKDKFKKIHYRFCDHITTHTMRRTAITTMLRLQMPEHLVRKISGHAAGSVEFHKYVAISQNYLDTETDKVFEKLNTMHNKSI